MDELEKLKAAKEVRLRWDTPSQSQNYNDWLDAEIARLEDPHAEAKHYLSEYEKMDPVGEPWALLKYFRHLEGELAHYKIQYQHAINEVARLEKEAKLRNFANSIPPGMFQPATEPLDPKRCKNDRS